MNETAFYILNVTVARFGMEILQVSGHEISKEVRRKYVVYFLAIVNIWSIVSITSCNGICGHIILADTFLLWIVNYRSSWNISTTKLESRNHICGEDIKLMTHVLYFEQLSFISGIVGVSHGIFYDISKYGVLMSIRSPQIMQHHHIFPSLNGPNCIIVV